MPGSGSFLSFPAPSRHACRLAFPRFRFLPLRLGFVFLPGSIGPLCLRERAVFLSFSVFQGAFSGGDPPFFLFGGRRGALSLFLSFIFLSSFFSLWGDEGILFFLSVEGVASLRISFFLFLFFSGSGFDLLLRNKSPP